MSPTFLARRGWTRTSLLPGMRITVTFLPLRELSTDEETLIVAFRRHTLLPLDDCLYAVQSTIPHLTRSSLHRLFQRHGISRLPSAEDSPTRRQRPHREVTTHRRCARTPRQRAQRCN